MEQMFGLHLLHKERPVLERIAEILELKAPNTARVYRSALKSFLRYANIPEVEALPGVAAINRGQCIAIPWTPQEKARGGALRRSEGRALRCEDIAVQPDGTVCIRLQETKSGQSATVALPDWAGAAVLDLLQQRRIAEKAKAPDWLFVETFKHKPERQMSEVSFYRVFKRAASAVGLPGAAPHAARASAITKLLQDGFAPYDVAEFSRHSSLDMLKTYDKRRREITEGLGKKLRF